MKAVFVEALRNFQLKEEFMKHPENAYVNLERVKNAIKTQSDYCYNLMKSLESDSRGIDYKENKTFLYERAKLIGTIEAGKLLGVDVSEGTWIYNAI